jgi:hypothetical protein
MSSHKLYLNILYFCLLSLCLCSCVNENMQGCRHYALTVKAVGADGEDINPDSLHFMGIYMFKNGEFVGMLSKGGDGTYQLGYDKDASLTFVAWANLNSDSLKVPKLAVGTKIEDALIKLKTDGGYNLSSSDLFYARKDFTSTRSSDSQDADTATLILQRTISSMSITTKHLIECFGNSSSYHYEIHGTKNSLNFLGELVGGEAIYSPISYFDENRNYITPTFYVFPSNSDANIEVDIYRGIEKLFSATTDSSGNSLKAIAGKQLNILIDFSLSSFTFKITPWGNVEQDATF